MSERHALIIDDNAQNLRVLSKMLSKQQVGCTEVPDPRPSPEGEHDVRALLAPAEIEDLIAFLLALPFR